MTEDDPRDLSVGELGDGDLAGEGARGLVVSVLSGDLDGVRARREEVLDKEEVESRGCDDDL